MKKFLFIAITAILSIMVMAETKMIVVERDGSVSKFALSEVDSIRIEILPEEEWTVKAGSKYLVQNEALGLNFKIDVVNTSGDYMMRNQMVSFTIEGVADTITLSDAGCSYMLYKDGAFIPSLTAGARENPESIVLCLLGSSSYANYTLASATRVYYLSETVNKTLISEVE